MKSKWNNKEANSFIKKFRNKKVDKDLALRIYTTQLLGNDPKVVLHGGGNTSVKSKFKTLLGNSTKIIYVKGSGKDMSNIEEDGFPSLELNNLLELEKLSKLNDFQMVNYQRKYMLDTSFPNASVETLLHAFLPHKYVDHSHSTAILSIIDQPNPVNICKKVFGDEVGIVPYIMPGFELAKKASEIFNRNKKVKGLILLNHGIFTFAEDAKTSYELMIKYISKAENELNKNKKSLKIKKYTENRISVADFSNLIRKNIATKKGDDYEKKIVYFNNNNNLINKIFSHKNHKSFLNQGPVTPDHVIRIKSKPLVLDFSNKKNINFENEIEKAIRNYQQSYSKYFLRNKKYNKNANILDLSPRIIIVKGMGIFSTGSSFKDAKIAMDVGLNSLSVILDAANYGTYKSIPEKEIFRMEYWPLELAKIKTSTKRLLGNVVVITGGLGTIGYSIGNKFKNEGAEVVLLDIKNPKNTDLNLKDFTVFQCDVKNKNQITNIFNKISEKFGGIDVCISNAGFGIQRNLEDLDKKTLDKSLDVNFFAHHYISQLSVDIFKRQNTGGSLLYNLSKQAINPGSGFAAYGLGKAASFFLMKQNAVEFSKFGIRFNGVNADRIEGGFFPPKLLKARAKSRGLTVPEYLSGNMLKKAVTADDVAQAFYHLSVSLKTTACIITVDGGNIEASLR